MLNPISFIDCIKEQLTEKGFKAKRIAEVTDRYEGLKEGFKAEGHTEGDASALAMQRAVGEITYEKAEAGKRRWKALQISAEHNQRVAQAVDGSVDTNMLAWDRTDKTGGVAVARAAVSLVEDDPRFKGGSYSSNKETTRGVLYALMSDVLNTLGKGAYGRQLGKAHLPNMVKEMFGEATGDRLAKQLSDAYAKTTDVSVDMFNAAGGSMRKLSSYRLPQGQSAAKLVKQGLDTWKEVHMRALDWDSMRWPDGRPIDPKDRERVLDNVYNSLSTNGASKIDPAAMRGQGSAVGNALEKHRFLQYKDANAWLEVHEKFSDGNVFDTLVHHIDDMSHKIAAVQTFGPNPELARQNLHAIVRKKASDLGGEAVAAADAELKNTFDPMFDVVMRQNAMDPNSTFGALITGTSNILTAAQLGSASFLAIPGDFMQTAAVRALNGMDMFGGIDFYMKSIATDMDFQRTISAQSGFVMDEAVMATYGAQRFTGVATIGPAATRHVSEAVMRSSLLSPHTRSARWATQAEFMGLMQRSATTEFENLPHLSVMQRYGISKGEWDAFRKNVQPWQPRNDVKFLRPIDILQTNVPNKDSLYRKFQGMVFEESRKMVPESTIEGSVRLRDTTRPDTLVGAILHSFAMYKNFPVSFMMIYGRLALAQKGPMTRLKFIAGLGAGMTMVGALGTQMREISKGRDPLPMNTPGFLGKAFLSGGALSIWGDFLFSGINEYGRGPAELVGGPLAGFAADATQLAFGDVFKFADSVGGLDGKDFESSTGARAVEFARRYAPGSTVWWARLALEREVFDRLQELADPKAYRKRSARARKQRKEFGNESWWQAGDRTPDRAPSFEGVVK